MKASHAPCAAAAAALEEKAADASFAAALPGAGAEALLGLAEGALRRGDGASGPVYAAALRAVEQQPLCPAAYNALGLAAEARGAAGQAAAAFGTALGLLSGGGHHGERSASLASALCCPPLGAGTCQCCVWGWRRCEQ
jgi:hypothetical protein